MDKTDWKDYFYYDATSPSGLRWATDRYGGTTYTTQRVDKGDVAGCKKKNGGNLYHWCV